MFDDSEDSEPHDSTAYTESIQQLVNKLCCHHLQLFTNHKQALVIRRKYTTDQISKLKKTLYHNLFLGLYSPYIQPSETDFDEVTFDNPCYSNNVYTKFAECIFNIRMMYGQVIAADKLQQYGDSLESYQNDAADNMLKLILNLSNYYSDPSEDMFRSSQKVDDPAKFFQFDQKAFDLEHTLQNNIWNNDFEVSETSVFTALPGSHCSGRVPSWMKQKHDVKDSYDLKSELTLFGGLTNSTVTSLDVSLSLPDLPMDPNQTVFNLSRRMSNTTSVDEGFHELSDFSSTSRSTNAQTKTITIWDGLSVWDEAVALDKPKMLSWEREGGYDSRLDSLYFCQLGKQGFDCMYNVRLLEVTHITGEPLRVLYVDEKQMFRDTLYALVGVPSQTYTFCSKTCSMKPALNIQSPGLGIESLYEFMCRFARVGTCYRQLFKFCERHSDKPFSGVGGGLILNSFIGAIKEILHSYRSAYFVILNFIDLTLMELWQLFEMFAKQLKFLADICLCSEAFDKSAQESFRRPKFPMGANLLTYIYSLAVKNSSTEQYPLLLYIFKCISVPYIRFLTDWLFEGVLNDPYDEFFVHSDEQYLRSRDRHFWTQGFQLKHKRGSIPLFFNDLSDNIFACGKAINLLKVTNRQHYLFGGAVKPPPIDITFSSARFDSIEALCKEYIKAVNKCGEELKAKKEKQKLESEKVLKEKLQKEKLAVESEIKRIEELELKVKLAIKQKKDDTLGDLKVQLEQAVTARKEKRSKKNEEDKLWIEEMKKDEDKKDAIKQGAREELILYYESLSRKAEQREEHARWIIERHELYEKRREFFRREEKKIKEEHANFINASLPHHDLSESAVSGGDVVSTPTDNLVDLGEDDDTHVVVDAAAADRADEVKEATKLISPTNLPPEMSSPTIGETTEDALIDLSTPESVPPQESSKSVDDKTWRNDQSKSIAKSLLYPTFDHSLLDKPNDEINTDLGVKIEHVEVNTESTLKTGASERLDNKGTSAKEVMYPESTSSGSLPADHMALNGAETNQLLDPIALEEIGIFLDDDEVPDTLSKTDVPDSTIEKLSKSLVFPELLQTTDNEGLDDNKNTHLNGDNDGTETKCSTLKYTSMSENEYSLTNGGVELVRSDGSDTKSLLYPGEAISSDFSANSNAMSSGVTSNFLGNETKYLLYPNGTGTSKPDEILEAKPAMNLDDALKLVSDDGVEAKRLLYPRATHLTEKGNLEENTMIVENGTSASEIHVTADEGHEMKNMLYPDGAAVQSSETHVITEFERPSIAQSLIYPTLEDTESNTERFVKEFERPSEMQTVIYSSDGTETENLKHTLKEFERPSEMQTIIYSSDGTENENPKHTLKEFERPSEMQSIIYSTQGIEDVKKDRKEFERPSVMKDIIYSSEKTSSNVRKQVKEFERPSTMQSIIYPQGDNQFDKEKVSYREYEPPTRIKELIYFDSERNEGSAVEKFNELTHEDIWEDYIPEPYIDNYNFLEMDPQSYRFEKRFPDVKNAIGDIFNTTQIDKDADLVKKLPLETVIKRSLTIPIQAQVSLVNNAIVKHFLEDLKIEDHFEAFRKFILLEDGEFGLSLCHALFEKIALGMKPQKFVSSMYFMNIIPEALSMSLYASTTDYSRKLKFFLKWMPEEFQPSDVFGLDFLELRYRVPWPCNIIITENSITKYNKVFSFLLRLKRASWSLLNVWTNLKRAGSDRKAALSPQVRQIHLFRHEMQHFVNNLERYIVNQIIHVSWREFQEDVRHVQSLDNLHKCHHHYLDKIIFRSLLSKNAIPVYNLINKMFGIIATFESRLLSQPWESDDETGFVQHPLFGMLKDGHCTFHRATGFLFSVISNLVKRGYQDHLDDLLLQVNFNTYYDTVTKK